MWKEPGDRVAVLPAAIPAEPGPGASVHEQVNAQDVQILIAAKAAE